MKASLLFSCFLILWLCWDSVESAPQTFDFLRQAYEGAKDMYRAYKDKKDVNWRGADKYFQARGNYDAAKRGPGGAWIAEKLSKVRAIWKKNVIGKSVKDNMAEQIASRWGRNGKDPNVFRPPGLPEKY